MKKDDQKPPPPLSPEVPADDPYKPLPGENIQAHLRQVPGPVTILRIIPPAEEEPN